jgi:hypothetical protein
VDDRTPHPSNSAGPFYVVAGCCTSCGVPEMAAENFAFESGGHCYVQRQPQSPTELQNVLRVVRTQEFGCIRYRGADATILHRLGQAGAAEQCDVELSPPVAPLVRNHVTFTIRPGAVELSVVEVLEVIRSALLGELGPRGRATACAVDESRNASVAIAWFEEHFHRIEVRSLGDGKFHLQHSGPPGLSEMLDDVLRAEPYDDLAWSTSESGDNGAPRPW